ncbi:uncharacterized protein AB675_11958 [Cyphellophora attinorum]|uniref:Uncharacterized protein n=1 Tax=Cyphellophora attinorum TaxID=1664694 RepID=A0A0N1HH70_9EURO|nr:uncharacterized protein AB675_11958 [Phialophora attinorum]KPI35027.1 hypothetical protein AB675_11958 [Phialophora attinorum]
MAAIAHPGSAAVPLEIDHRFAQPYKPALITKGSASLAATVLNYKYEDGGRYQSYNDGNLLLLDPNATSSETATTPERLDILHHIFKVLTGGDLWRAPISGPNARLPKRVLDLSPSSSGIWAMEAADALPGATVIAQSSDSTAASPKFKPSNCTFRTGNDLGTEKFDFIHARALSSTTNMSFPTLLRHIYDNLNPGGWVELQDYAPNTFLSDDDTLRLVPALVAWQRELAEAGTPMRGIADEYKRLLSEVGFVDVQEDRYKAPIGTWARGKTNKELGLSLLAHNLDAVEPLTTQVYTRHLGYSLQQTQRIVDGLKRDLVNSDAHIYVPFVFVYGRKPLR